MVCHVIRRWDPQLIKLCSDSQQWKRFQHGASTGLWIWISCNDPQSHQNAQKCEYRNIIKNRTQVFVNSAKWQGADFPIEHTELPTNMFLWFYVFNAPWCIARLEKKVPTFRCCVPFRPQLFRMSRPKEQVGCVSTVDGIVNGVFQQWME